MRRVSILKAALKDFYFNDDFRNEKSAHVISRVKNISFTQFHVVSEKSIFLFFIFWLQFIRHETLHQHFHIMKKMNRNHHILKMLMVPIVYSSKI